MAFPSLPGGEAAGLHRCEIRSLGLLLGAGKNGSYEPRGMLRSELGFGQV